MCHLLSSIDVYSKEVLSCSPYEDHLEGSGHDPEAVSEYENMDLENFVFEKVTEEIEAKKQAGERIAFHLHAPTPLLSMAEGICNWFDSEDK